MTGAEFVEQYGLKMRVIRGSTNTLIEHAHTVLCLCDEETHEGVERRSCEFDSFTMFCSDSSDKNSLVRWLAFIRKECQQFEGSGKNHVVYAMDYGCRDSDIFVTNGEWEGAAEVGRKVSELLGKDGYGDFLLLPDAELVNVLDEALKQGEAGPRRSKYERAMKLFAKVGVQ